MLGGCDSPRVRGLLESLAQSGKSDALAVALAELIARGEAGALHEARRQDKALLAAPGPYASMAPRAISGLFRNPSPEAAENLGAVAIDSDASAELRRAAAHALSMIHTRESLPHLGKPLEQDRDPALLASAVIGLSFYANGIGIQNPADGPSLNHLNHRQETRYRTPATEAHLGFDEARAEEFISFWRRWWSDHRAELEQPKP